ncbi:DNA mismatch repair endonuclease MutL [Candidatus Acetothermia bacterium]|jgi:DNA mismatch repair protein MutL|nr:DNA mismatch repair endonuclease MutL [Candidatus Acetothermia bacterium]MCI2426876.1 DNA mismatch repair endonuclease MutL [Candidatus Acetothermia bacterium]MCI2428620.1 DNA mismatch repair endonuclease MutL [Candidatus Acetothermia bacterium]
MKIKRLEQSLYRKIAAGEVIERPASVLKELLENAIDAKSESIEVDIEQGGITRIVVRDNGEGMDEADLQLCAQRYTTSKIASEADLDSITTLGFRGEALASIGAVSQLIITSRPAISKIAYQITIDGGIISKLTPAARGVGTSVEVRNLFFNLPARHRFLSPPRTEFYHLARIMRRIALAYPRLGFRLRHDQRIIVEAPRVEELRERIGQIYNAEVSRALIEINAEESKIRVSGFISRPEITYADRRNQLLVVNGRPITDAMLSYTLSQAYRGRIRSGAHPLVVIHIDLPADKLDANVHPRKEEIRFFDQQKVQQVLMRALQVGLTSPHLRDAAPFLIGKPQREVAQQIAEPLRNRYHASDRPLPLNLKAELQRTKEMKSSLAESSLDPLLPDKVSRQAIGQLHNMYILVQTETGLVIVDQHVAHEQILVEQLQADIDINHLDRQRFLTPVRIELPFDKAALLNDHLVILAQIGIALDDFGGGTFLLREYPARLVDRQAKEGFDTVIDRLLSLFAMQSGDHAEILTDELLHEMLSAMACAGAIKAGMALTLREQQDLIDQLYKLENPYICPHGRPIIIEFSRHDLDRRFKRS